MRTAPVQFAHLRDFGIIGDIGGQPALGRIVFDSDQGNLAGQGLQFAARNTFPHIADQHVGFARGDDIGKRARCFFNQCRFEPGSASGFQRIGRTVNREHRADTFAVAQGACEAHHAFDVTVTETAATITPDKRQCARARDRLLAHMPVQFAQARLAFEKDEEVFERGLTGTRFQPAMQCLDKCQVVWRVNGQPPAGARQRRIGRRTSDTDKIGMKLEIAGDVFARDRVAGCVHHQLVETAARQGVDAFMRGDRPVFEQNVIAILIDQSGDEMIHEACIDERRIRRNTHDDVCIGNLGRECEPRQHIVFRPTHDEHAMAFAELRNGIVQRIGAGRDGDLTDQLGPFEATHHMPEQGFARDGLQHFAGKARGTHARLHDRDDIALARHAAGFHVLRMWRSGRIPSEGSARHSLSSASDGCGPLNPEPSAAIASRIRAITGAISSGSQQ